MAHAWVNITYMSDDDYKAELAARKAKIARARRSSNSSSSSQCRPPRQASASRTCFRQVSPRRRLEIRGGAFSPSGEPVQMRANRIAVATVAAVTAFVLGGKVGIGQQAPGANPAQSSQPQVAAPLPLGYVGEAIYPVVRRLGADQERPELHPHRLLQPQQGPDDRYSDWPQQPPRAGRSRHAAADALRARARMGRLRHCRFRRTSAPRSTPGRSWRTASRRRCSTG